MPDDKTTRHHLNSLQWRELYNTRNGNGRYWPCGRQQASLKALANRRLVSFQFGTGWSITPDGASALDAYLQENPHAFI